MIQDTFASPQNSLNTKVTATSLSAAVILLYIFAFVRPLTSLYHEYDFAGFNFLELFSLVISYLLLIAVLMNLRRFKLDSINLISVLFCLYCILNIGLGGQAKYAGRVVLPFVLLYASRSLISNKKQMMFIVAILILGYVYPIIGSAHAIREGSAMTHRVYASGIDKFGGMFFRVHAFGHAMLFFSFIACFAMLCLKKTKKYLKILILFLLAVSLYGLYQAGVRTTWVGLIVFWSICLWRQNKKLLLLLILGLCITVTIFFSTFETRFWNRDVTKAQNLSLNTASSGRLSTWSHNLSAFIDMNVGQKLCGVGLGNEVTGMEGVDVWSSHNDDLSLLVSVGIIGIGMYLSIMLILLRDIRNSSLDPPLKFFFIGMVVAVLLMNGLSNGYVSRPELSQLFWLFMGFFYRMKDFNLSSEAR